MTPKQRELYNFLLGWINAKGYAPSYAEMKAGIGANSASNVARMLDILEDDGLIKRDLKRKRGIEIVKPTSVKLHPEIIQLTDNYARTHGISRETATNELLRAALEAA